MSEQTLSEINDGWLALCQEAREARYNRDVALFHLFKKPVNSKDLQDCENAETTLNKIEGRMLEYRKKHNF